jgi:hypothetical protein
MGAASLSLHRFGGINNKTPPTTANTPAASVVKKIPQKAAPRSPAIECMKWWANKCPYPSATNKTQTPLSTRKAFNRHLRANSAG